MKQCSKCPNEYDDSALFCSRDSSVLLFTPGTIFNKEYEIISLLGTGGMGAVYKVKDIQHKRICVIKVMINQQALQEEEIKRFKREAEMTAQINHPNIVTIHSSGVSDNNTYFILMEYIEGETLADLIKRES